jgi:ABC-2 type transport system ATP-binding protein
MPTATTTASIEIDGLTKAFGGRLAVDDLSFSVAPGRVTGFLGPNGAGKTTTIRMVLGLAEPDTGSARILGRPYRELEDPASTVGTLIDAAGFHPGRTVRQELLIRTAAAGFDDGRVDVVLAEVDLGEASTKRVRQLSLGMRQRLGLAAALLGDPDVLVLDEPANGLDPAGMHWLRMLLRDRADRGTAVLVSSHVLAELALFADDIVVVDHGRLVAQSSLADLVATAERRVHVASPHADRLRPVLAAHGAAVSGTADGFVVTGLSAPQVGDLAAAHGATVHELRTETQSLEDVFLQLTGGDGGIR